MRFKNTWGVEKRKAVYTVYAYDGKSYAGYSAITDGGGQVTFTLREGDYRFRADYDTLGGTGGVQFWSGTENTCTIPGCEEDSVILPGGTGQSRVSIDYTYDALNRLISAEYSNGTAFGYTYDAAGNVLTYAETHFGYTTTTTYTYDAANQLLTAVEDETAWYYTYDGNGSLIQSDPGTSVANGSTRYTYNTAGYLTKVENFTTEWQTQSEMTYDGLGNRLEVTTYTDGEGSITRYQLDSGVTLAAIGSESSTYYLYGMGVIGTLGESWSYILSDGTGSTRQLVDEEGTVNLSVSYTPWGDTMEVYGSGMLNLGYLGGVYDAGTGLIYMGNGQYYDPSTGRFLTRGAQPDQSNPYTPWSSDPAGMLIGPFGLIALLFAKKKKHTKLDAFIVVLILFALMGLGSSIAMPVQAASVADISSPFAPLSYVVQAKSGTVGAMYTVNPGAPDQKMLAKICDTGNDKNHDVTKPPDGITWFPSVRTAHKLYEVGKSQYYINVTGGRRNVNTSSIYSYGPNQCGQISLSMVTWALRGSKLNLGSMIKSADLFMGHEGYNHFTGTTEQHHLAKIFLLNTLRDDMHVRSYECETVRRYYIDYENSKFNPESEGGFDIHFYNEIDTIVGLLPDGSLKPDQYARGNNEYPNLLRNILAAGHYYIPLVNMEKASLNLRYYDLNFPDNPENSGHWVVVTGFSGQWEDDLNSTKNWVRIYNPMFDRIEYYQWNVFSSYIKPGNALELWKGDDGYEKIY
ncbi:MAG: hypothetical protein JEZ00_19540 [Anaerolineaceae bacterium]|nr:hypothetical protein [Anaerolineaceae bacterium]